MKKLATVLLGVMTLSTILVGCGGTETSGADAWKSSTISLFVPGKAGGGSDLTTRALATNWQTIESDLSLSVENFDNTAVCYQTIKGEKADGSALSLAHSGLLTQYLTGSLDVNPEEDLTLIAALGNNGIRCIAARIDAPYDNFEEFLAYAKENPGEANAGMAPNGTNHFLLGKMESALDIKFNYVEASNEADRLTGLAGGFIDIGSIGLANGIEYEEAGKLKILCTVGSAGSVSENFYPGRPENFMTMEEMGYDCAIGTNYYLFGPAGMDEAMVESMNASLEPIGNAESSFVSDMSDLGQIGEWYNIADSKEILANEVADMTDVAKSIGVYGLE
ncbi:MAG: Bug family tripartite tricarboxylate transporter substrate binding protein [Lachnospirales bacterium]